MLYNHRNRYLNVDLFLTIYLPTRIRNLKQIINKLERNFQISIHHLISQREKLDNGLYDRFG